MGLTLVATPIGNASDIGTRALEILRAADVVILEEFKESTRFLRDHGISGKKMEQLNEHSTAEDLKNLIQLCSEQNVVLITDCGTPGFCDPGADLVRLCRQKNIAVKTIPGASSLMGLLSLSSQRLDQFVFRGFIPAENVARAAVLAELKKEKRAIILMDTPYRFQKMLQEMQTHFSDRSMLVALNLTQETEMVIEGFAKDILAKTGLPSKAEFMLLIYPAAISAKK